MNILSKNGCLHPKCICKKNVPPMVLVNNQCPPINLAPLAVNYEVAYFTCYSTLVMNVLCYKQIVLILIFLLTVAKDLQLFP